MKWRSSNTKFKDTSLEIVNEYLKGLESIRNIKFRGVKDENLQNSFKKLQESVYKGVKTIRVNIDDVLENVEWNKLNIALFGETNAGKSTLLEVLSNGDGETIGDGQKDFTQTVHIYKDESINIIDMPGIEGKEEQVIDRIKEAVNKAHVIFYVIGTNKEPEETTINKIKEMLHENTKVYTIINIRGRASQYKRKFSKREYELVDEKIKIVENRVKEKFKEMLGKHYVANINIQAHLALLANDKLNKNEFNSDKVKAMDLFKSKEEIIKFSNLKVLKSVISRLNSSFNDEIRISNVYKFLGLFDQIETSILKEYNNFDECVKKMDDLTDECLEDVKRIITKYKGIIGRENKSYIKKLEVELKDLLSIAIKNGYSQERMDSGFKEVKEKGMERLNGRVNSHIEQMKNEIMERLEEFEERMELDMKYFNFEDTFDFENIIESLKLDFTYILGQVVDIALSIAGIVTSFFVNPLLGIGTLVMTAFRKLWDWIKGDPDKKKREAYRKGSRSIEDYIKNIENKIESNQSKSFKEIDHKLKISITKLKRNIEMYFSISKELEDQLSEIEIRKNSLSHFLLKDLLGPNVKFSYLDLDSLKGLIVGYSKDLELLKYLKELLRLDELYMESSLNKWINSFVGKSEKNVFLKKVKRFKNIMA